MVSLTGQSQIGFQFYLTQEQRNTYVALNCNLQSFIGYRLLGSPHVEDVKLARLALDILQACSNLENGITLQRFLLTVLKGERESFQILTKVLDICVRGGGETFFKYASTTKIEYYAFDEIVKITSAFFDCANEIKELPVIAHLLSYEEGGTAQLYLLRNHLPHPMESDNLNISDQLKKLLTGRFSLPQFQSRSIQYLASLSEGKRLYMRDYSRFFSELHRSSLSENGKIEVSKLAIVSTIDPDRPLLFRFPFVDLETLIQKAEEIEQSFGEEVLSLFRSSPHLQKCVELDKINHTLYLLQILLTKSLSFQ